MIHPHTQLKFISPEVGFGVVATHFIPKGTITWVLDELDLIISCEKLKSMGKEYEEIVDKYSYRNRKGEYILCWDNAKYVNHSFIPSCMTSAYEYEFAVRDIYPGEELTDDYGYLNVAEPMKMLKEEGSDRTIVYPDDILNYHKEWDSLIEQIYPLLNRVDQPLLKFLSETKRLQAERIAYGKEKMDSLINCYLHPGKL